MTETAICIVQKASNLGLKLGLKQPNTLTVESAKPWPRDFAEMLRDHKPRLLALLRLPFCIVDSEVLKETIFFCDNDETKAALVEAGAEPFSVYTRAELQILVAQNRVAPLSIAELRKLHEIKLGLNGTLT